MDYKITIKVAGSRELEFAERYSYAQAKDIVSRMIEHLRVEHDSHKTGMLFNVQSLGNITTVTQYKRGTYRDIVRGTIIYRIEPVHEDENNEVRLQSNDRRGTGSPRPYRR